MKPNTSQHPAIGAQELDQVFGGVLDNAALNRVALAVSGGSDSTALMLLFAEWLARRRQSPAEVVVLTVDHGLRPQAASEAATVAQWASRLGFRHAILVWTGAKPKTGVQAAARAARHRLMAEHMRAENRVLLVTAHTADDQAETLLMRLARGSGVDGLAAMAPLAPLEVPVALSRCAIMVARPLLGLSKARLRAALAARGMTWLEDESNAAPIFERGRLRAAASTLADLGLTAASLGLSARRLQRARAALEAAAQAFSRPGSPHYRIDACGFIRIDAGAWRRLPSEVGLRVLLKAIAAVGGSPVPVPLAKLEGLTETLAGPLAGGSWTLARAAIRLTEMELVLEREPGRRPSAAIALAAGHSALWDGRFWVGAGPRLDTPLLVRGLGRPGLDLLRPRMALPAGVPQQTLRALPGFWQEARLVAVPSLGFAAERDAEAWDLSAVFAPLARRR
jgi:tRNA(Ile)-lysidine synthase